MGTDSCFYIAFSDISKIVKIDLPVLILYMYYIDFNDVGITHY